MVWRLLAGCRVLTNVGGLLRSEKSKENGGCVRSGLLEVLLRPADWVWWCQAGAVIARLLMGPFEVSAGRHRGSREK
jgi:hypothetical protein